MYWSHWCTKYTRRHQNLLTNELYGSILNRSSRTGTFVPDLIRGSKRSKVEEDEEGTKEEGKSSKPLIGSSFLKSIFPIENILHFMLEYNHRSCRNIYQLFYITSLQKISSHQSYANIESC